MRLLPAILLGLMLLAGAPSVLADGPQAAAKSNATEEVFDMSLDQNIASPAIPSKYQKRVAAHMDALRRNLRQHKLEATSVRQGEVVMVTIPCFDLFGPNSTELLPRAAEILSKLKSVVDKTHDYKILLAVYSDDTGDDEYADAITEERATAIDDFLFRQAGKETFVVPYGLGKDDPVKPNNSILNRRANRRCEIYIVPTLELAKSI